jgi:hypothetical protein
VKTFGRDQVLAFLVEVDELLDEPVPMEIIGAAKRTYSTGSPETMILRSAATGNGCPPWWRQ